MAHKCVRCGKIYLTGNKNVLKGCECGSKLFIFIDDEKLDNLKKRNLKEEQIDELEKEIRDLLNLKNDDIVILPMETIRKVGEGKYLIDIVKLFENKFLIIKIGEGKYLIDFK